MVSAKKSPSTYGLLNVPPEVPKATSTISFMVTENIDDLKIQAKSYAVYDVVAKQVILSKNEGTVANLASLTKIMTAITAKELATSSPDFVVSKKMLDGGYDIGLRDGQRWNVDEFTKYMLVFSSNDAANIIADTLGGKARFIDAMNAIASREGMSTLHFTNPNGLDTASTSGGKGSALDVALLMAYAYKKIPLILEATTKPRATVKASTGYLSGVPNTNQEVAKYSGVEGSKTGFTDEAGGNLAIILDIALGRPVVIVVMGSTKTDRFKDVEKLYEVTKKALK
jgi:D-alanyl-D-alanine carboxypeptidase (penicillin-binding protein 5/6)